MNVSYEWLRSLVPVDISPAELRDLITARCATVDELIELRSDLAGVVVGRVVEAGRHPNSDHLWVTKVDAGGPELLDVVCGAPNVTQGKLYPFAPAGTTLPGGLKLEKRKIRGATSNGMLCSSRELGLGQDHEGIMELRVDVPPGTPFLQAMPVGDSRLVIDVTPNRPDLLSHLGVAREVSAATGVPMAADDAATGDPRPTTAEREGRAGGMIVRVEDAEGAPRYMGAVIRGVTVKPSPEWLVARLEAIGSRSINNIVDITNYLLHELGQPMHAFDAGTMAGGQVVVRRARAGETLTTLDGTARTLAADMTVIADAERAQAVAGVMGGASSEVTTATTDIFLEVACFDPRRTRATRMQLGMSSDASYRFERGVDPELQPRALARAVRMIVEIAGGQPEGAPVDIRVAAPTPLHLRLSLKRVARILGVDIPAEECAALLSAIGFTTRTLDRAGELEVTVPSWRPDVTAEVDLLEEVARLRGFSSFPNELRPYRPGTTTDAPLGATIEQVRTAMVAAGLYESRAMPFVSGGDGYVRVSNPLSEDEAFLRRSLLETLARRAEHNLARMQGNVRLFEIGSVFAPSRGELPGEWIHAAAVVMGQRRPPHFTEPKPPAYDAWDAKGLAETLLAAAFPGKPHVLSEASDGGLWSIEVDGASVGKVVQVALDAPVWASAAYGVEVRLGAAPLDPAASAGSARASNEGLRYRPIPVTPAVELDLALLVPVGTTAASVEAVIRRGAGEMLERLELFDEFRGGGIPDGYRSVAWRLTFRHPERTLRDKEVEGRRDKLLKTLENELSVRHRT